MSGKKKTIIIVALLLVVFIGSISYALWSVTLEQTDSNIVKTGCFTVDMVEQTDEINLPEEYPVTDAEGRKYSPFTFTIQNTCTIDSSYSVNLKVEDGTTLEHQYVKAVLDGDKAQVLTDYEKATDEDKYQLTTGTLAGASAEGAGDGESVTYNLRLWLDADTPKSQMSKDFYAKIVIENITTSGAIKKEVIATGDISEAGDGSVIYTYYNTGELDITGNGRMSDEINTPLVMNIITGIAEKDESFANSLVEAVSLNDTAEMYVEASFGMIWGYKMVEEIDTDLTIFGDLIDSKDNDEFVEKLKNVVLNDTLLTEAEQIKINSYIDLMNSKVVLINSVKIEEGILNIGDEIFRALSNVDILLPSSIKIVGNYAFRNFTGNIILNEGLEEIRQEAFAYADIDSLIIPSTVTSIRRAPYNYSKIKTITFNSGKAISSASDFEGCDNLETIIWNTKDGIPATFTRLTNLKEVIITKDILYIVTGAFADKTTNSNLVLKFSMTEDKKESIKNGESSDVAFDFTNYNVEWGYTE